MSDYPARADLEKPTEIIDETLHMLDQLHGSLVDATTRAGYERDALKSIRPVWEQMGTRSTANPLVINTYASGVSMLGAFREEVRSQLSGIAPLSEELRVSSGSTISLIASATTNAGLIGLGATYSIPIPPALTSPDHHDVNTKRFSQFDTALGDTYRAIWEVLYGTRADPERSALYLIRQAFDHFFSKLAPDDHVRGSQFWTKKVDGDEDAIWRMERVQYAAATHVRNPARAQTLLASANHMVDVYRTLNHAHERGALDVEVAHRALREMNALLETWADAIGI